MDDLAPQFDALARTIIDHLSILSRESLRALMLCPAGLAFDTADHRFIAVVIAAELSRRVDLPAR